MGKAIFKIISKILSEIDQERLNRLKVLLEEEKSGKDVEKEIADVVKHLRRINITKAIRSKE